MEEADLFEKGKDEKRCNMCGKETERVYQNGLCKECAMEAMRRLIPMINEFRNPKNFKSKTG